MRWTTRKLVAVAALGGAIGWWVSPGRAFGATPEQCSAAWDFSHGSVAKECRADGWTIRHRLVLDPHRVVGHNNLPHCRAEDGPGPCWWSGHDDGTGGGLSFVVNKGSDRPHYIWEFNPADANWVWVAPEQDHQLDKQRRHRDWTRCVAYQEFIACPWRVDPFTAKK